MGPWQVQSQVLRNLIPSTDGDRAELPQKDKGEGAAFS